MLPYETQMTIGDYFRKTQDNKNDNKIYYIQKQNNSLHTEYSCLIGEDVPSDMDFATEAFGMFNLFSYILVYIF